MEGLFVGWPSSGPPRLTFRGPVTLCVRWSRFQDGVCLSVSEQGISFTGVRPLDLRTWEMSSLRISSPSNTKVDIGSIRSFDPPISWKFPRNIDACRWDNELKSDEFYSAVLMTSRQFKNQTRISCDLCDGIAGLGTGRPPAQSSLETPHLLWHQASVNEATNSFTTATAFHRLRSLQQWTLQRSMESHSAFSLIETDLTQREGSWSARQI